MLEYVGSVFLLPLAAALLAMLLFGLRLSLLSIIGTGHAGAVLATLLRTLAHLPAIRQLGLFDPFLAVTAGSLAVLGLRQICCAVLRRRSSHP